jgi:hypothetical protein
VSSSVTTTDDAVSAQEADQEGGPPKRLGPGWRSTEAAWPRLEIHSLVIHRTLDLTPCSSGLVFGSGIWCWLVAPNSLFCFFETWRSLKLKKFYFLGKRKEEETTGRFLLNRAYLYCSLGRHKLLINAPGSQHRLHTLGREMR